MEIRRSYSALQGEDKFLTLMGKNMADINPDEMINFRCVSGKFISLTYIGLPYPNMQNLLD